MVTGHPILGLLEIGSVKIGPHEVPVEEIQAPLKKVLRTSTEVDHKQERQNRANMRALEQSGPFDEAKTRVLATQNSQTQIELQVAHARIKSEMVQILTADQKAKLAEFEATRDTRGPHGPPPPPAD